MIRECIDCFCIFDVWEDYQTRCFPCWRKHKEELDEYERDRSANPWISDTTAKCAEFKSRAEYLSELAHKLEARLTEAYVRIEEKDLAFQRTANMLRELEDNLPRLIQLCHPDKHGSSLSSIRATQWLLSLKKGHP